MCIIQGRNLNSFDTFVLCDRKLFSFLCFRNFFGGILIQGSYMALTLIAVFLSFSFLFYKIIKDNVICVSFDSLNLIFSSLFFLVIFIEVGFTLYYEVTILFTDDFLFFEHFSKICFLEGDFFL